MGNLLTDTPGKDPFGPARAPAADGYPIDLLFPDMGKDLLYRVKVTADVLFSLFLQDNCI